MKMFLVSAFATAVLFGLPSCPNALSQTSAAIADKNQETPLACDRSALTPEERKRHFNELGPAVRARKKSVRELPNGFAFEFPADRATFLLVSEWAAGEHLCCPFFDIDLRWEPNGGPLWLSLTGRDGVKQFMQAEGSVWLKP
jgi:hypothetical protein